LDHSEKPNFSVSVRGTATMVEFLLEDIFRVEKVNPDDKKLFEKGTIMWDCSY
jgi:hypothetical protein